MAAGALRFAPRAVLVLFKSVLGRFLNLELSALQADGRGKIISNPRVVTADQMEATIEQGTEIPYQQATSSGATSVLSRKRAQPQSEATNHAGRQRDHGPEG